MSLIEKLISRVLPSQPAAREPFSTRRTTRSMPPELLARLKIKPFDQQLVETFMPSRLAREKGWGIFEDMLGDAQVSSVTTIKRYAPISNGYQIVAPDNSTAAAEIAQFSRDCLNSYDHRRGVGR